MRSRLRSSLSDNGVRLPQGTRLAQNAALEASLRAAQDWPPGQWQVIEGLLLELRHAQEQRQPWRSLSAQAVLADPRLLSLVQHCGARELAAFALGAFVGDIQGFADPRKLVKHLGLHPAFDDSGAGASADTGARICAVCLSSRRKPSCVAPQHRWPAGASNCSPAKGPSTWSWPPWPGS